MSRMVEWMACGRCDGCGRGVACFTTMWLGGWLFIHWQQWWGFISCLWGILLGTVKGFSKVLGFGGTRWCLHVSVCKVRDICLGHEVSEGGTRWTGQVYIHRQQWKRQGMLVGDWCQTGACGVHASWVAGGDGIMIMTSGGGGKWKIGVGSWHQGRVAHVPRRRSGVTGTDVSGPHGRRASCMITIFGVASAARAISSSS